MLGELALSWTGTQPKLLWALSHNVSGKYMGGNISAYSSLRSPFAVRYDRGSFAMITDVLILVQIWSIGVVEQRCYQRWDGIAIINAAYAERPRILLHNRVLSRWTNLSALRLRTPRTGAILDGSVFTLLICRDVWLESEAKTFWNG